MSIRVATEADIPVLVKLVQAGLADDYIWKYCFPRSNPDSAVYIEKTLRQFLRQDKNEWLICVNQELDNHEIVAMALWHLPVGDSAAFPERESHSLPPCLPHPAPRRLWNVLALPSGAGLWSLSPID